MPLKPTTTQMNGTLQIVEYFEKKKKKLARVFFGSTWLSLGLNRCFSKEAIDSSLAPWLYEEEWFC